MKELKFYWRMGDYSLEACPQSLVRFNKDEPNVTIRLDKHYISHGEELRYVI